ncbi:hypothetical protein PCK1_000436 [Pneumocystis canis]|nr:hypothetical protein PCK1_000436 [Pneumocystis canis]
MISFEESIEHQKENIEPLRQGRSVKSLAKVFSEDPCSLKIKKEQERCTFENEIDGSDDLDDPLDVWVKYIKWTNETYPHGQSAESGLVPLLERCIRQFMGVPHYKDDPRYLKVWIQYVKYIDDPRELFCFLAYNDIGQTLSTFYEEYASFLETNGRTSQANEIYQLGIERRALKALLSVLKLQDGKISEQKKENYQEAKPWVGEKLLMKKQNQQSMPTEKFTVFCDEGNKLFKESSTQLRDFLIPKKEEKIIVDLEAIYYENGEEFSLDELKAKTMGLIGKIWEIDETVNTMIPLYFEAETTLSKDSPQVFSNPKKRQVSPTINTKAALADIFDIFNQPLKCEKLDDSSDGNDNEVLYKDNSIQEKSENLTWFRVSPSNDKIYTNNLDDEVNFENHNENKRIKLYMKNNRENENIPSYKIFTPLDHENISPIPFDKQHSSINLITPIIENTDQLFLLNHLKSGRKEELQHDEINEPANSPFQESVSHISHLNFQENEQLITHTASSEHISSPKDYIIKELVCNPFENNIQKIILSNLNPPMSVYNDKIYGKLDLECFNKLLSKKSSINNQEVIINLGENSTYFIKKKLGEGAFAPVYLAEITKKSSKSLSQLRAIKIERSTIPWEFYITRQAKYRLGLHRALASIIDTYEMYIYRDISFLIMKYRDQGTILDLVNIFKAETGNGVDETLAIFFTIELLRTLEQLHDKGILHGDLKPDNCLLRFDPVESEWVSKYQKDGSGGWASKGIIIIDFGRGIDLKMFSSQVQFITDSETDEQDCAEMREARPWTYQIDYHGLATIIHTLLFGKHIEIVPEKSLGLGIGRKKYRLVNGFKRYWQQHFWKKLFDLLLNPVTNAGEKGLPVTKNLKQIREEMEIWLMENSEKGIGLKGNIWKIETLLQERK